MFYMRKFRKLVVSLIVIYAVVYFVGFLCVRSGWGRGLVADYISSKTGCFVELDRASLCMNFKINVFNLNVFADEEKTIELFSAPTLCYGWSSIEARRIKVLADFTKNDIPFSSSLHKFGSEEDFYKVEKLNAFSLSLFEYIDDVNLHDISIVLKIKDKTEEHFLTKFIKEPMDLPDEKDVFYFVLGDNLRWITTRHGKIISTISRQQDEKQNERQSKAEETIQQPTINNQQPTEVKDDVKAEAKAEAKAEETIQQSTANNQQPTEVKDDVKAEAKAEAEAEAEAEETIQQSTANNQQPTEVKDDVKAEAEAEAKAEAKAEETIQQSTANNQQPTEVKDDVKAEAKAKAEAEETIQQSTANNQQPTENKEEAKVETDAKTAENK